MNVERFVKEILVSELTDKTWGFTIYIPKDYPDETDIVLEGTGYVDLDIVGYGKDVERFKNFTLTWLGNGKCVDNYNRTYIFDGVKSIDELREAIECNLYRLPIPISGVENDYEIQIEFSPTNYVYYYPDLPRW